MRTVVPSATVDTIAGVPANAIAVIAINRDGALDVMLFDAEAPRGGEEVRHIYEHILGLRLLRPSCCCSMAITTIAAAAAGRDGERMADDAGVSAGRQFDDDAVGQIGSIPAQAGLVHCRAGDGVVEQRVGHVANNGQLGNHAVFGRSAGAGLVHHGEAGDGAFGVVARVRIAPSGRWLDILLGHS